MQKKYLVLAVSAAILVACGETKIDNLPEKSWQALAPFYSNTSYTTWKLEPAPKVSGDNTTAKIEYAPHQWSFGSKELKDLLVINFPATVTQVKAISDKVAEYTTDHDLAKWTYSFAKELDAGSSFKATLAGDFKSIYQRDVTTKKLLKFDGSSTTAKLDYSITNSDFNMTSSAEYGPQTLSYQFSDNDKQANFSANWSMKNMKGSEKSGSGASDIYSASYSSGESISKAEWKDFDSVLIKNSADLVACFSLDSVDLQKPDTEIFNCLLKYIQQGSFGQFTANSNVKTLSTEFSISVGDLGLVNLKVEDISINLNSSEKDGFIGFDHGFNMKNMDLAIDESKLPASFAAQYPIIKNFLPKDLSYNIKVGDIKRSAIQNLKSIDELNIFDLSKFNSNIDFNYVNTLGFIKLSANFIAPDNFKASDSVMSLDAEVQDKLLAATIQIQNFDKWVEEIAKIQPQAALFGGMVIGYGVANSKDASILEFKITFKDGKPLINDKPLPF